MIHVNHNYIVEEGLFADNAIGVVSYNSVYFLLNCH